MLTSLKINFSLTYDVLKKEISNQHDGLCFTKITKIEPE
jgi:hypothetical protein